MTSYGELILKMIRRFFRRISFYMPELPELPDYPTYYYAIAIVLIIIWLIAMYGMIDSRFKKKHGYPIVDLQFVGIVSSCGALLYGGVFWRDYAVENKTDLLFPNIFIGFFAFAFLSILTKMILTYYREKRVAGWFNVLLSLLGFLFLFLYTGIIVCILLAFFVCSMFSGRSAGRGRSYSDSYNEDLSNRYMGEKSASINIRRSDDY